MKLNSTKCIHHPQLCPKIQPIKDPPKALTWKKKKKIVPLLARSIPDLSFNTLMLNNECPSLKLDPDCSLRIQAELISSKPRQNLRFAHRRVPDQHHFEHIIYLLIGIPIPTTARHLSNSKLTNTLLPKTEEEEEEARNGSSKKKESNRSQ